MGFIAISFAKAASAMVGVIKESREGFLEIFGPLAEANPRELRWAISGMLWIVGLLAFGVALWWSLPIVLASKSEDVRNYGLVIAGLFALPLAMRRSLVASRQAQTANRQADTAERGQVTDRFSKAVAQLAENYGEGEGAQPNLTVRIGAIYALGRIAKDSPEDAQTVFDVLGEYIRAVQALQDHSELPVAESEYHSVGEKHYRPLRSDLKAGFKVWGSFKPKGLVQFDLRSINFSYINLANQDLSFALLTSSKFNGGYLRNAIFTGSQMAGASFVSAALDGANMTAANLTGADLSKASLIKADLSQSDLNMATLSETILRATLLHGTFLIGAKLAKARLSLADLRKADLSDVVGWSTIEGKNEIKNLHSAKNVPNNDGTK